MAYDEVLAQRLTEQFPGTGKKMFGGYGFFMEGTMISGVMGDRLMIKLGGDVAEALNDPDVEPFAPGGKAMRGWVTVSQDAIADDDQLQAWVERAIAANL